MFVGEVFDGFDFDDQRILHEDVREVVAQRGAIGVLDLEGILRKRRKSLFSESGKKTVFINLLQVAVAKMSVELQSRFPHLVAQLKDNVRFAESSFHGDLVFPCERVGQARLTPDFGAKANLLRASCAFLRPPSSSVEAC